MQRLHQTIINQEPIEKGTLRPGIAISPGFFAIQLAAREGRLNAVLELILLGEDIDVCTYETEQKSHQSSKTAEKTPFYLALEYGHTYLADVLLALGANKDLAIEIAKSHNETEFVKKLEALAVQEHLVYAAALWVISQENVYEGSQNKKRMLQNLLPQLNRVDLDGAAISGLIELVLQQKQTHLVNSILTNQPLRCVPEINTAGYWAALADVSIGTQMLNKVCKDDKAFLLTLQQLHDHHQPAAAIKLCLASASEAVKKEFAENSRLKIKPADEKLSDVQEYVYNTASKSDKDAVDLFKPTFEDYTVIFKYALKKKNFVAFQTLHSANENIALLNGLLEKNENQLAQFCFFNFNLSATLAIPGVILGIENFSKLLKTFSSPEGYAHQLVSTGIKRNVLPSKDVVAFVKQLLPTPSTYVGVVLRAIEDRYQIKSLRIAEDVVKKALAAKHPPKKRYHYVETKTPLSSRDRSLHIIMLDRFDIALNAPLEEADHKRDLEIKVDSDKTKDMSIFKNLSSDLWREIFPYLNGNTLAVFPAASQQFYEYKLQTDAQNKFGDEWKLQRDIQKNASKFFNFAEERRLLQALITSLEEDLVGRSFIDYETLIWGIMLFVIFGGGLIASAYFMHDIVGALEVIKNQLKETMTSRGRTCKKMNYYSNEWCGLRIDYKEDYSYYLVSDMPECSKLCKNLHDKGDDLIGPIFGIIFGSVFFLLSLGVLSAGCQEDRSKYRNDPLTSLSDDVQTAMAEIKQERPTLLTNNFPTATRDHITSEARRELARLYGNIHQFDINSLNYEAQSQALIIPTDRLSAMREEKIQSRTNELITQIRTYPSRLVNTISPARIMGGLFNMFQPNRTVNFDDSNVPLLCGENVSDAEDPEERIELLPNNIRK